MSDAFLVRRGGSGGLSPNSAVIHVTAPAGSTVSFAKGGGVAKVLGPEKSHVNANDNTMADWYYSVSPSNYGTWTVTASSGGSTATNTISVNAIKQYDMTLIYELWIHKVGVGLMNEFTVEAYRNSSHTFISNANEIRLNVGNGSYGMVGFTKAIDVSLFNTCTFEYVRFPEGYTGTSYANSFYLSENGEVANPYSGGLPTAYVTNVRPNTTASANTWGTASIDVSSLNNAALYFKFIPWNNQMAIRNLKFV